ncbi:MAG: hypothetical protein ABI369_11135 [Acetobacteraceae bacterium]
MEPTVRGARGDFHARIRRVEGDLFKAEYTGELNPENPNPRREFVDSHLANSLEEAKVFVENLARSLDYRRVVWDSLPG